MPTHDLEAGDTVRDLAEKYELRGEAIKDGNFRFEQIRE